MRLNRNDRPNPEYLQFHIAGSAIIELHFEETSLNSMSDFLAGVSNVAGFPVECVGAVKITITRDEYDSHHARLLRFGLNNINLGDIIFEVKEPFELWERNCDAVDNAWNSLALEFPELAENDSFVSRETANFDESFTRTVFSKRWQYSRLELVQRAFNSRMPERRIRVSDIMTGRVIDWIFARTWTEALAFQREITAVRWFRNDDLHDPEVWELGMREERYGYVARSLLGMIPSMFLSKAWALTVLGYNTGELCDLLTENGHVFTQTESEIVGVEFNNVHDEMVADYAEVDDDTQTIADVYLRHYHLYFR